MTATGESPTIPGLQWRPSIGDVVTVDTRGHKWTSRVYAITPCGALRVDAPPGRAGAWHVAVDCCTP